MFEIGKYTIDRVMNLLVGFCKYLLWMEGETVKNASSLLLFTGHNELETRLLIYLGPNIPRGRWASDHVV